MFVFCLLGIGYYLGCQHSLIIASTIQTSTTPTIQTQTASQSQQQSSSSLSLLPSLNSFASTSKTKSSSSSSSSFQLHEHITLIEDRTKFQKLIVPKVKKLLTEENF